MISNTVALSTKEPQKGTMDLEPEVQSSAVKPSKKLSESRLRLAAIQALPTTVQAEVTLKEAIRGTERTFVINDQNVCNSCINLKPINRLQCESCKGLGYQQSERQIEVKLPAGLMTGQEIRHPGLGGADFRSGKNGDLLVRITVTEHPYLKVEGKNVTCTVPVSLYDAVLGADIEVPTATGKVVMKLQPLTQPGRVYRLKGLGIAGGDQLVTIEVNMPQMLTKEQVKLFQQIKEVAGQTNQRAPVASV